MLTNFKKKSCFVLAVLFLLCQQLLSQNAGINFNSAAPNASAAFDVDVTAIAGQKKGLLIPRVTFDERTAMNPLPASAPGLMVYQTDGQVGFYYNTSGSTTPAWTQLVNNQSLRWDLLQSATANLFLSNADKTTSFTFNGITNQNAYSLSTNTITSGNLLNLFSNSNDGASAFASQMLNVVRIGTNANPNHISIGIRSTVSNTGTSSTNYAGYFRASGGSFNYALMIPPDGGKVSIGSLVTATNAVLSIKDGHFQSQQSVAPTIAANANAGILAGAAIQSSSSDMAGTFSIVSGAGPYFQGAQATVTYNKPYSKSPAIVASPVNPAAARSEHYISSGTTGFTIFFNNPVVANNTYVFNYIVVEN